MSSTHCVVTVASRLSSPRAAGGAAVWACTLGTLIAATTAHADLIAYEPFNYPANADVAGRNGGTGWVGPWFDMLGPVGRGDLITYTPGLTHPLRTGTGGAMGATLGQQALAYSRPFDFILLDQQTIWLSMLYRGGSTGGNQESVTMGLVFGGQDGTGSVPSIRASASGVYQLYIESSNTAINLPVPGPSPSRTDHIVVRYQAMGPNTLQFTAFLNPTDPLNPGTPLVTRTATLSTLQFAAFRIIYAGPSGSATTSARLDEIGIAATYPGLLLVPTPGAAAVGILGLLAAARRRR